MSGIQFIALPTEQVDAYRTGALDANGQEPEHHISDGTGNPCRHCLADIAKDDSFLVLAHRPFDIIQPYAEVGPIFLHTEDCARFATAGEIPLLFRGDGDILMRGYNSEDRIIYGTGKIVTLPDLPAMAMNLFGNTEVSFIHLRSASNNCFQCRIERI